MRQTLLRILLGDLWAIKTVPDDPLFLGLGNGLYVGAGYFLIPWALLLLYWFFFYQPAPAPQTKEPTPKRFPLILLIFPLVILFVLPRLAAKAPDGLPVFGYGFMLFLAFIFSGWDASHRAKKEGLRGDLVWDLGIWLFLSGLIGSRLFHLIQYREQVYAGKNTIGEWFAASIDLASGGMVLYGGLILGIIAYFTFCRLRKIDPMYLADLVAPSIFVGVAFGRVGCLLNGCCYGDVCTLPWAIHFPMDSVPFAAMASSGVVSPTISEGVWLQPSQIYSTINAVLIWLLASTYFRYRARNGSVCVMVLLIYPATRFVIEFLRADELGKFNTSLTIAQWVSMAMFAVGIALIFWLRKQPLRFATSEGKLNSAV